MPQPAKQASPEWTDNHESALSGLVGLGIPKKQAQQFLEALPPAEVGELMRQALASRTRSQAPPAAIPGAPSGAVPLHPQTQAPPQQTAQPPPAAPASQLPAAPIQKKGDRFNRIADMLTGWMAPSWVGGGPLPPKAPISAATPAAPITPAAAQTQPASQPAQPPEKPRIRIPAAGRRIPPAPIGKAPEAAPEAPAETKQKAPPLPLIRSREEYEQLAPGTEFIWRSDGHIYSKPESEVERH